MVPPTPPAPKAAPVAKPTFSLVGKLGIWIHSTQTALGRLHDIQALGTGYVLVKIADGLKAYQPAERQQLCKNAATIGLPVVAWAYVYPRTIPAQIDAICANLPDGCTDVVLDAEVEWEKPGTATLAHALCSGIAQKTGHRVNLHLSGLYTPQMHPTFPFAAFLAHCQSWMPQSYAEGVTPVSVVAQRTDDQAKPLAAKTLGKLIIPTVNTPGMLTALARRGYRSLSIWLWDGVQLPAGANRPAGDDMGVIGYQTSWKAAITAARGR